MNLPARARSRFGRHLARGGLRCGDGARSSGRGNGRRATAARQAGACVRRIDACAQLPSHLFCSATWYRAQTCIIGFFKAAENEIILV